MSMNLKSIYRRRVLENTLIIATTMFTCTALRADHQDNDASSAQSATTQSQGAPGQSEHGQSDRGRHGDMTQHFIKEAAMGGQMEVQMGQLAEQKGQSQDVKNLGQMLVKDHTMANQKLQQIAQQKGITLEPGIDQKHQHQLDKFQSQSGAEFDKAFVQNAVKDHKKDIAEFERAEKTVQDPELKSFISETLPTLRNHLQMAQSAARTLGVDVNGNRSEGTGAPAPGVSGSTDTSSTPSSSSSSSSSLDKPQSSTSSSSSPDASIQGNVGDHNFSANADVNSNASSTDTSTRTDLQGDHKVLGLSTSKTDGKILGIIPIPGRSGESGVSSSSSSDTAIGGPAISTSGTSSSERVDLSSTPSAVRQALKDQGADSSTTIKRMTVYEADVNGKKVHITEQGKVYTHDQTDTSTK